MSGWKHKLKSLIIFNGFAFGAMYAVNRIISSSAIIKNLLNPGVGSYYSWRYGNVFYRKIGSGSPLLLIHDLNSISSGFEWSQIEYKLSKNHTVYTIDLPGCGRSEKPALTYTNFLYVQMIADFIRDVVGKSTDIAATGLSSSFVTMAALFDKTIIRRIVMINPVSLKKLQQIPDDKSKIIQTIMNIPVIGTSIYNIKVCRQNMEYILTEKLFFNPFRIQSSFVDAYYEAAHRGHGSGKYLMSCLDGFYLNADIRRALSKIENNIRIIIGDQLENEREIAESYRNLNDSITIKSIRNTKMLPQLEAPDEIYSLIDSFL